jgi:hypothetical protein
MEAISVLEAPVPSPAWMTVTPLPARSKRKARIFMVAGCLVAGMVLGGVVGAQRVAGGDAAASSPQVFAQRPLPDRIGSTKGVPSPAPPFSSSNPAGTDISASWNPTSEGVVLSMIQTQPAFAGYVPICVLDVLERHFATPAAFFAASEGAPDSPPVKAAAVDVVTEC